MRGVGRVDPEHQLHHAVLERALHLVAGVLEGVDHRLVVGQHLGDELVDPPLAARLGEVLEQELADAAALVGVLDEEGDLGVAGPDHVVAPDGDHLAGHEQDQRDPVAVVDLGEPVEVALGELGHRREEPVVLRLVGDAAVELDQQLAVLGLDRPDVRRPPVAQQDVGLPVPGRRRRTVTWSAAASASVTAAIYRSPLRTVGPHPACPRRVRADGSGENGAHGTTYDAAAPPGRLRGAHPRHRHPRRDADVVPRVRLLGHLLAGAARRARRAQAGAAAHPLHDGRDGRCGPTAGTSRAPASSARSWVGCTRTATARSTTRWSGWRSPGRCGCRTVDGHGNFGSPDDSPAAMRYTECRMAPAAVAMTASIDEDTVDFKPNYDSREIEPVVLPAAIPHLLVNGSAGIAVGMATNIAPHNLVEVVQALRAPDHPPQGDARRPDALHPRPGPAHRRQDRRPRRHPRRLRDRPRHLQDARDRPRSSR